MFYLYLMLYSLPTVSCVTEGPCALRLHEALVGCSGRLMFFIKSVCKPKPSEKEETK